VASGGRESRIDRLAVGHLTLAAASAGHPFRRLCEFKPAAHVRTSRSTEIGHHPARVVRNEARSGVPVVKGANAPARTPPRSERPEVIDRCILGDLEELSAVCLAVGQRCAHCSGSRLRI
jgi:hypothetical protein